MKNVMNWTNTFKNLSFISVLSFILYSIVCGVFNLLISLEIEKPQTKKYNKNLVRATYPNYANEELEYALKIFKEERAPIVKYRSFIGYRRNEFTGEAISVNQQGFRLSINHKIEDSVWFFGGSTMWGTGSDNRRTIPSYFALKTGDNVLNLGESSFTSLQELIQLQLLLSKGFLPKEVVFYDGVNDGYQFCQNPSKAQITHAYSARWSSLDNELRAAKQKLNKAPVIDLDKLGTPIIKFYRSPLIYFQNRMIRADEWLDKLSGVPISSIRKSKRYLYCDDPMIAKEAAKITINSWRSAAAILKSRGVPAWFVLQPSANYMPQNYRLDYLISSKKQAIINEKDSYKLYYQSVRSQFLSSCEQFGDCDSFIDLSELFFGIDAHLFIDTCHLSPNGNEIVSAALADRLRS